MNPEKARKFLEEWVLLANLPVLSVIVQRIKGEYSLGVELSRPPTKSEINCIPTMVWGFKTYYTKGALEKYHITLATIEIQEERVYDLD